MSRRNSGPKCAGCDRPVMEGTQVVIGLRAVNKFGGPEYTDLGEAAAPCHPRSACIRAASHELNPDRDLARALEAGQATDEWDRLSILLEAR